MRIYIIFIFVFFFLIQLQMTLIGRVSIYGYTPNVMIGVVAVGCLLASRKGRSGLYFGVLGGLFLDVFSFQSNYFFGFYTLICVVISLFIQAIVKQYVRIPVAKRI